MSISIKFKSKFSGYSANCAEIERRWETDLIPRWMERVYHDDNNAGRWSSHLLKCLPFEVEPLIANSGGFKLGRVGPPLPRPWFWSAPARLRLGWSRVEPDRCQSRLSKNCTDVYINHLTATEIRMVQLNFSVDDDDDDDDNDSYCMQSNGRDLITLIIF